MEPVTTLQVIDALDLVKGSHETFSLDGELILGQSTNSSDVEFAQGFDVNTFASAPSIKAAARAKEPIVLMGTENTDTLVGSKGRDEIYGKGGDDILIGGKGNDFIVGGGHIGSYDQMTGGKGKDTFSLVYQGFSVGYLGDDVLDSGSANRGFAVIHDFKTEDDRIVLAGTPEDYGLMPVFWEQSFGSATKVDTAIVRIGVGENGVDVVGVLKDVNIGVLLLETRRFEFVN